MKSGEVKVVRYSDLKKCSTIEELIRTIPYQWVEKSAVFLLVCLCLIPMCTAAVRGNTSGYVDYAIDWQMNNWTVGFVGWLVGLYLFSSYYYKEIKGKLQFNMVVKKNALVCFLFAMLLWSFLACVFSENRSLSFWGTEYRRDGIVSYAAYAGVFALGYALKSKAMRRVVMEVFVLGSTILAALVFLNIPTWNTYLNLSVERGIFHHPNHFGYYITMTLLTAIVLLVLDADKIQKEKKYHLLVLRLIQIGLIANASALCFALGSLLGTIAGILGFVIFIYWVDKTKLPWVLFAAVYVAGIIAVWNTGNWNLTAEFSNLGTDIKKVVTLDENAGSAGTGRWRLWLGGLQFAYERPVFGYGADNLMKQFYRIGIHDQRVHNEVIQYAASSGIPAAVLYVSGLFGHLMDFIRKFRQLSLEVLGLYCIVGAYLVSSMFGNTMYYTAPFFFMILGVSSAAVKEL